MSVYPQAAIRAFVENSINNMNTTLPARVDRVDMAKMQLDATPLIPRRYINGFIVQPPLLENIPIVMPRTANSILYIPIKPNDQVVLHFAQRDIVEFLESNDLLAFYEPRSRRKYDINDAIATPGLYSFNTQVAEVPLNKSQENPDDVQLIHVNNVIRLSNADGIEINTAGTTINIDNNGAVTITGDVTVNGTITADEVTANGIDLSTHVHGGVEPGAGTTGSPQ